MTINATCPNGHALLAHDQQAGRSLPCPKCGAVVAVPIPEVDDLTEWDPSDEADGEVDTEPALELDDEPGLELDTEPGLDPNRQPGLELAEATRGRGVAIAASGFVVGFLVVVCAGMVLLFWPQDPVDRDQQELARQATPDMPPLTRIVPDDYANRAEPGVPSSTSQGSDPAQPRVGGKRPAQQPPPQPPLAPRMVAATPAYWNALEAAGRKSKSWLQVNFVPRGHGRLARFKVDGDADAIPSQVLAEGEGVPLFACSPITMQHRGWTTAAVKPPAGAGSVLRGERETGIYRICQLNDFGNGGFDDPPRFDYRHVWSPEGNALYVLAGQRQGKRRRWLRKVNTRTWEIELELELPERVTDLTWTAQGLVAVADSQRPSAGRRSGGETWVRLVPSNRELQYLQGGLLLLDAQTLRVRNAWAAPRVQEVAGNPASDLIYVRSDDALLVVDVKRGELLNCYAYHELAGGDWQRTARVDLHFLNPRLSADGTSLLTQGVNERLFEPHERRPASGTNAGGPRSVNRFSLGVAGANLEWVQSQPVGGVFSRYSRRSDIGVGQEYLCLPDSQSQFHMVLTTDFQARLGSLTMPPETAVTVDTGSKTIFLCWTDGMARQLRLRMIRGQTDTEVILAEQTTEKLGPIELSAAPGGRGAMVFTPETAYWVEPHFRSDSRWAFTTLKAGETVAADEAVSGDRPEDEQRRTARRLAEIETRCKAATALLHVPAENRFGSCFCIDASGLFLTNAHHVDQVAMGDEIPLVLNAGRFHQRTTTARLLRLDSETDLALLKTEPNPDLVPLELGRDDLLTEATALKAFGYTMSGEHEIAVQRYSAVGVKPGVATALRKSAGQLVTIQFDGVLLPGNTGGPVVDDTGQVVGVIRSGIQPFGLNFVIAATQYHQLEWPEVAGRGRVARTAPPMDRQHAILEAKAATALVVLPSNSGFGTAFCVDERGFFATNAHVVEGIAESDLVTLVLHPGESGQRTARAKVVRRIASSDLALLELVDMQAQLKPLELADDAAVAAEMEVTAFGFPYGDALAVQGQQYPSVSVNIATIAATSTETLGHASFEFQTQLNPGNSGGPVIDAAGRVVGVVFATRLGARKSFAIPVARLRELMLAPDLTFQAITVQHAQRRQAQAIQVMAKPYLRSLEGLEVEITLRPEHGPASVFALTGKSESGIYQVNAPLIRADSLDFVKARFEFVTGSLEGVAADYQLNVGAATVRLSQAAPQAFLGNQPLSGLERVTVSNCREAYTIDASQATGATIETAPVSFVDYQVVARQDGGEVAEISGTIAIQDLPAQRSRRFSFLPQVTRAWSSAPVSRELPPLRVTATFGKDTITGLAANRPFEVDGTQYELQEVKSIRGRERPSPGNSKKQFAGYQLTLGPRGNISVRGMSAATLAGLESVSIRLGTNDVIVDLTQANSVLVEPAVEPNVNAFRLHTPIAGVAAGGRGKWLVLHLPQLERLVVFDVAMRRVQHQIPLSERNVLFAAGAETLLLVFPELNAIQRWDLASGLHERTAELPSDRVFGSIALGSGSTGPLLMHGYDTSASPAGHWTVVDIQSLQATELMADLPEGTYPKSPSLSASADGGVFGTWDLALIVKGETAESVRLADALPPIAGHWPLVVHPSAGGRWLFYRNQIFNRQRQPLQTKPRIIPSLPTNDDDYCLLFAYSTSRSKRRPQVSICSLEDGAPRPLAIVNTFAFDRIGRGDDETLPLRMRYHLYLDSRVFVCLPASDDVLRCYDLPPWE